MNKKRRYTKRKEKKILMRNVIRFFLGLLIVSFIVSFTLVLDDRADLKRDNITLNNLSRGYESIYEESEDDFTLVVSPFIEKYKELRKDYLELLLYLETEELSCEIYTVTGYSANDMENQGTTSTTSIGFKLNAEYMEYISVVAVDPKIIPYGSFVFIKAIWEKGKPQYEKMFIAGDCGGDIKGKRLDIFFDTKKEADEFGIQGCQIRVIANEQESQ